ncbi:SERTA domain-containing protein 3 [Conger conger]|uniref:SERTA domain-containing protein 3 n=1 Tax=Conger conger TaxID=82655 RepID=UPI002A598F7A|nr:SERTA domain-containing protein 3 [Conger conger]
MHWWLRMTGKGLKRKLLEGPEGGAVVYESQRQLVLDISLDKFQHCGMLAEPSLLRSVLIGNTLRQIQEEIRLEVAMGQVPGARPLGEAPLGSRPAGREDAGEDWTALSSEEDFSLSSAVSSILKDLDTVIDGGPGGGRTPLGSIENLQEGGAGPRRAGPRGEAAVFGSLEVMRSSYLRDVALDDLFLDIDTSACERDLPGLPSPAGSPYGHGLSARDGSDLEHIMEILVRS